jgi:hypothetical protein
MHATMTLPVVWTHSITPRMAGVKLFFREFGCVKHERGTNKILTFVDTARWFRGWKNEIYTKKKT